MRIPDGLHRLKIVFNVTGDIERAVYLYLLLGEKVHLIDTGVAGSEMRIAEYLAALGRNSKEIDSIFITHAHPDHIGSLHALKKASNCTVYAHGSEKSWIEDIDLQYKERPIPNFYGLVAASSQVDVTVSDGDVLSPEPGISLRVIETSGHSQGSLSFHWLEKQVLFTGDAVPVAGDIPIFINLRDSIESLKKIRSLPAVEYYVSAWDEVCDSSEGKRNLDAALACLQGNAATVKDVLSGNADASREEILTAAARALNLRHLMDNPLFRISINSAIDQALQRR